MSRRVKEQETQDITEYGDDDLRLRREHEPRRRRYQKHLFSGRSDAGPVT
jgi:hypothetical protein